VPDTPPGVRCVAEVAKAFESPQQFILETLRSQGVEFDAVFVCPHFKSDGCGCRKPRAGLLLPEDPHRRERKRKQLRRRRDKESQRERSRLEAQSRKDAVRAYELVYAALGA